MGYLVFASLVIPRPRCAARPASLPGAGWAVGLAAYAAGLVIFATFDWPAGAVIVRAPAVLGVALALA